VQFGFLHGGGFAVGHGFIPNFLSVAAGL